MLFAREVHGGNLQLWKGLKQKLLCSTLLKKIESGKVKSGDSDCGRDMLM